MWKFTYRPLLLLCCRHCCYQYTPNKFHLSDTHFKFRFPSTSPPPSFYPDHSLLLNLSTSLAYAAIDAFYYFRLNGKITNSQNRKIITSAAAYICRYLHAIVSFCLSFSLALGLCFIFKHMLTYSHLILYFSS